MSSMTRTTFALLAATAALLPTHAYAQDGTEWDRARLATAVAPMGAMQQAIDRWRQLNASDRFSFADYAGFLLSYPGFPEAAKFRANAERALDREYADPARVAAFFDRYSPVTNQGRAAYAVALSALRRPEALNQARDAWRGGPMSASAEAALFPLVAGSLSPADHDARMDALLWANDAAAAEKQLGWVSPAARAGFTARLALVKGSDPGTVGVVVDPNAARDAGYVYNRSRMLRATGQGSSAAYFVASRPSLSAPARDQRKWVAELLAAARAGDASSAARIAAGADEGFAKGTDISQTSFQIRDDYTSLMWLGGTKALYSLGNGSQAAPLFYRYGAAARTPQTRTKGFYWAGRAMAQAGNKTEANRYFEMAAAFPDQYYGMLAVERLGRALPAFANVPKVKPSSAERSTFYARPLTQAVREVARGADWPVAVRFFREISDQAETEAEHVMVADLARELGRRDLGVILGQAAHADGYGDFHQIAFPLIPTPAYANWTMVHAISRQESQFAMNAISHAGARGLMQLMPGTAREQAGKMGMSYDPQSLTTDAGYNLSLGNGYFARMMDYYGGSYPLAVAAYNAGPGNVNKWLRANGDPRNGGIDWVDWAERIPVTETRNYVQRVLENAVVYEAMNPERASYRGTNPLSHFLGKRYPG
ncbi:soluble lytic murein transglycosylase [Novosphingobium kunmingense]|uniref:Soluble lytic murein transglycosylase n=1 Tax=Novosphingobium kunmingense TaxID=1211806 RepID=A0A2N0I157_9SPHN|nr:lytic transglycosylase domain-containing protein [Novosphingobium kunmingense]PKB24927.1 soluble lytic murein transglycosylase [Novosphingobium kunmingense]